MDRLFIEELSMLVGKQMRLDYPLKKLTSFNIGGPAKVLVDVQHNEQLQKILQLLIQYEVPWRVLGRGSNVLAGDKGFDGVIIRLVGGFKEVCQVNDIVVIRVGAGLTLTRLIKWCAEKGFAGAEFLFGIPGTVGGAVIMNAGAWREEMSDILTSVELVSASQQLILDASALNFDYRRWREWGEYNGSAIITTVSLSLRRNDPIRIREKCRKYIAKRKEKQPRNSANCGSFFKNPEGYSAGKLIDDTGLKGVSVGGAKISRKHANFFVNTGEATSEDIKNLMELVQQRVKAQTGVELVPEVHFI